MTLKNLQYSTDAGGQKRKHDGHREDESATEDNESATEAKKSFWRIF